jgi:hypothetical protein
VEEEGDGEENETNVFDGRTLMVYLPLPREGETEAPYGAASGPSSRRSKKKRKERA